MAKKQRQKQKQQSSHKGKAAARKAAKTPEDQDSISSQPQPKADKAGVAAAAVSRPRKEQQLGQVVGLVNLGHTCYFNAAIQVLVASPPVRDHYLQPGKRGPLGSGLHEVVSAAYGSGGTSADAKGSATKRSKSSGPSLNPRKLHSAVVRIASHLKVGEEQDSHELLRLLLEGLQKEELRAMQVRASHEDPPAEAGILHSTFVSRAFGAELSSKIECVTCRHVAPRHEEFMDISIEVVRREPNSIAEPASRKSARKKGKRSAKQAAALPESSSHNDSLSSKKQRKQAKQAKKAADLGRKQERRRSAQAESEEDVDQPDSSIPFLQTPPIAQRPELSLETPPPRLCSVAETGWVRQAVERGNSSLQQLRKTSESEAQSEEFSTPEFRQHGEWGGSLNLDSDCAKSRLEGLVPEDSSGSKKVGEHSPATALRSSSGEETPGDSAVADASATPSGEAAVCAPDSCKVAEDCQTAVKKLAGNGHHAVLESNGGLEENYRLNSRSEDERAIEETYENLWEQAGQEATDVHKNKEADRLAAMPPEGSNGSPEGSLECPPLTPRKAHRGGSIEACMAAFFAAEEVTWECPSERRAAEDHAVTPISGVMRRNVSFSGAEPAVVLIPGSAEQRGTDGQKALRGLDSFRRSFKLGEAYLQVTADVDSISRNILHLALHPNDDSDATSKELTHAICITDVPIAAIKDPDSEEEQVAVMRKALLLINCIVDMVLHEGVDRMQQMVAGGIWLRPQDPPKLVCGNLPAKSGGGTWEYPISSPASGSPLSRKDSYLSILPSSPASSQAGEAPPSGLEEPNTPAAHSTTSFESIDLSNSPVKCARGGDASEAEDPGREATSSRQETEYLDPEELDQGEEAGNRDAGGTTSTSKSPVLQSAPSCAVKDSGDGSDPVSELDESADRKSCEFTTGTQYLTACEEASAESHPAGGLLPRKLKTRLRNPQRQALKSYLINRAPELLTVHLKRFQIDIRGRAKKITGPVAFALDLDVSPWCDPEGLDAGGAAYELVGVVVHQGSSMRTGHYYAYVRRAITCTLESHASPAPLEAADVLEAARVPATANLNGTGDATGAADVAPNLAAAVIADPGEGGADSAPAEASHPAEQADAEMMQGAEIPLENLAVSNEVASESASRQATAHEQGAASPGMEASAPKQASEADSVLQFAWFYASDTNVRKVSVEEVLSAEAYILLYQRCH